MFRRNKSANKREPATKTFSRWFLNGVKIVVPSIVLIVIYQFIVGTVQHRVGPTAIKLGDLVGIPSNISGSGPVCVALLLLVLTFVGSIYDLNFGRRLISWIDSIGCRWKYYHSLRQAFKLPEKKVAKTVSAESDEALPAGTTGKERVVWFLSGLSWDPIIVRSRFTDEDGVEWLTLINLSTPIPSGFSVKLIEARLAPDAGLNAATWQFWRAKGAGDLPAGAKLPPKISDFLQEIGISNYEEYLRQVVIVPVTS